MYKRVDNDGDDSHLRPALLSSRAHEQVQSVSGVPPVARIVCCQGLALALNVRPGQAELRICRGGRLEADAALLRLDLSWHPAEPVAGQHNVKVLGLPGNGGQYGSLG